MESSFAGNVARFTGFADVYHTYRPQPPTILVDILTQVAQRQRPRLVVDLGSGTGLSTQIWAERADAVVGVEPSADMRQQAESQVSRLPSTSSVTYRGGYSHDTGLSDGCADIVTCSQALHWMHPDRTFAEVARILRPGGVFAAYDCDWPPTVHWEVEAAYDKWMGHIRQMEESYGLMRVIHVWPKEEHLARMAASRRFRYVKEFIVHHVEQGNAARMMGIALSQGSVVTLLKQGFSERDLGLDRLLAVAERTLDEKPVPWYWSYRVRMGVV